ncbi:MAG: AMP-binding protein, partial [Geminicoccaceae bacterium]
MHQVFDALAAQAKRQPDAIAFRDDYETLRWSDLAGRVYGLAMHLQSAPSVIGIDLPNGVDYVIADLAATLAARRVVPLPTFFGDQQCQHILHDAGVGAVIGFAERRSGVLPLLSPHAGLGSPIDYAGGADRVIYTSGSSGTPKGVIVGDRQLQASINGLMNAVQPSEADRHLSILPFAQLLEQVAGIFLPIMAGTETVIAPRTTATLFGGPASAIAEAFDAARPTTSLLVPQLLNAWVTDLKAKNSRAAKGLRFVAVGGAPTSPHLIDEALALGIPVHEGYGL